VTSGFPLVWSGDFTDARPGLLCLAAFPFVPMLNFVRVEQSMVDIFLTVGVSRCGTKEILSDATLPACRRLAGPTV
jgi:hypothetical protein